MLEGRTYSISELQTLSGFDRRTIVYYIQQGLLPKAGRRGPNTRYPDECLVRLRFVRGLKDLQDQGRCGTITLAEMRGFVVRLDANALRGMLERHLPPEEIEALRQPEQPVAVPSPQQPPAAPPAAPPPSARPTVGDGRSYGLADAGIRQRPAAAAVPQPAAPPLATDSEPLTHDDTHPRLPALRPAGADIPAEMQNNLGDLLRELEVRPGLTGRRLPPGASEQWTEIPITSRVFLSVRGLSEADAPLADATARALKKLLRAK